MVELLIAHLIGDWVLQPRSLAVNKGKYTVSGWVDCFQHVAIYTCWVAILVGLDQPFIVFVSVFVPHFIIDKFSLATYWMRFLDKEWWYACYYQKEGLSFEHEVQRGFAGLRYAVIDNTMHIICLYLTYKYLMV